MEHFPKFHRVCQSRKFGLQLSRWWGAIISLCVVAVPASAVQVRLRDGQEVRLSLRNVLTTENAEKNDIIDFDVAEDVVVNGHVVIAKGAPAQGKVLRIKGVARRGMRVMNAKNSSVIFGFVSVRTVDNQTLPLRAMPYKPNKKGGSKEKENEIEESSPIPGYAERVIGAEKGKVYPAFIDSSAVVNVPETAPATVSTPPTATAPVPAQPAQAAPVTAPQPAPQVTPAAIVPPVETEPASVEFDSNPAGADILIDGSFVGNTPSTLRVAAGRHVIEFRLRGYRSWTQTMVVIAESHPRVKKNLEKE
jgi:hypothetical protein